VIGEMAAATCGDAAGLYVSLKTELIYQSSWPTRHELEMEVFSYFEASTTPAAGTPGPAT
jgi:hypothetical protein